MAVGGKTVLSWWVEKSTPTAVGNKDEDVAVVAAMVWWRWSRRTVMLPLRQRERHSCKENARSMLVPAWREELMAGRLPR